jgi:hypothetical protein
LVSVSQLEDIVANPSEGLNEEHKTWLDPQNEADTHKILRAIYALRNRDGGYLIIGLNSGTQAVDSYPFSESLETKFHLDEIQALVSRHANDAFDIEVRFVPKNGDRVVVIVVPEGVKKPVVVSKPLIDKRSGKELISKGDLFVRTLNASGVPSSSKIQPKDYDDLFEICFNNREADIARFIRRHLSGLGLDNCLTSKRKAKAGPEGTSSFDLSRGEVLPPSIQGQADLRSRAHSSLAQNETRFVKYLAERDQSAALVKYADSLTFRVSAVLSPEHENAVPSDDFFSRVASSNPRYTGWPFWLDSRGFRDASMRPFVSEGAWNIVMVDESPDYHERLEFYRLNPRGELYARRVSQDDTAENARGGRLFDPFLMIVRVAEVLATATKIAPAAGWETSDSMGVAFEWSGLKNRRLSAWANPRRLLTTEGVAHDDQFGAYVEFGLDTPAESLAPYVQRVMQGLLVLFQGFELNNKIYEDITQQVVERRL